MTFDVPVLAGLASTVIFAIGTMPMLKKAATTKDLASYSLGNIAAMNVGNVVHSVYVFSLPLGPVWLLHGFYLVSTALMLVWYLAYAYERATRAQAREQDHVVPQVRQSRSSECRPTPAAVALSSAVSRRSRYASFGRT